VSVADYFNEATYTAATVSNECRFQQGLEEYRTTADNLIYKIYLTTFLIIQNLQHITYWRSGIKELDCFLTRLCVCVNLY